MPDATEPWLDENSAAKAAVELGLQQAAAGEVHDLGSFAAFVDICQIDGQPIVVEDPVTQSLMLASAQVTEVVLWDDSRAVRLAKIQANEAATKPHPDPEQQA